MCGATTTNDAIKAFRYAQQRHLTHCGVKLVLILSELYLNIMEIDNQKQLMDLFQASL